MSVSSVGDASVGDDHGESKATALVSSVQQHATIAERLRANPRAVQCVERFSGAWRAAVLMGNGGGGFTFWSRCRTGAGAHRRTDMDVWSPATLASGDDVHVQNAGSHISADEWREHAITFVEEMMRSTVEASVVAELILALGSHGYMSLAESVALVAQRQHSTTFEQKKRVALICARVLAHPGPTKPLFSANMWIASPAHSTIALPASPVPLRAVTASVASSSIDGDAKRSDGWPTMLQPVFDFVARDYVLQPIVTGTGDASSMRQLMFQMLDLGFRLHTPLTSVGDLFATHHHDFARLRELMENGCVDGLQKTVADIHLGSPAYARYYHTFVETVECYTDLKLCVWSVLLNHSRLPRSLIGFVGGYLPWWRHVKFTPTQRLLLQTFGHTKERFLCLENRLANLEQSVHKILSPLHATE